MDSNDFWILGTCMSVAIACAAPGSFLVSRGLAMLGDAISHSILPGVVGAYLLTQSRDPFWIVIIASGVGLLSSFLIQFFSKGGEMKEDSAIGLVYTLLFSIGVILLTSFASKHHIDQECVLYGDVLFVPYDEDFSPFGFSLGPLGFWKIALVACLNLAWFGLFFRRHVLASFDVNYAKSIGLAVGFWQFSQLAAVSVGTVASFEAVGAILVLAFLSIPSATAYLFCKSMKQMVLWSCVFGCSASIAGYWLAIYLNVSVAACISIVAGIQLFTLAFYLAMKKKSLALPTFGQKPRSL